MKNSKVITGLIATLLLGASSVTFAMTQAECEADNAAISKTASDAVMVCSEL